MSKHRPAATFDELDDAEVQIRLDEETYRPRATCDSRPLSRL